MAKCKASAGLVVKGLMLTLLLVEKYVLCELIYRLETWKEVQQMEAVAPIIFIPVTIMVPTGITEVLLMAQCRQRFETTEVPLCR